MTKSLQQYRRTHHASDLGLPAIRDVVKHAGVIAPHAWRMFADQMGVPVASIRGAATYCGDMGASPDSVRLCRGTSCVLSDPAPVADPSRRIAYCLGHCHQSPVLLDETGHVRSTLPADHLSESLDIRCESPVAIVTRRVGRGDFSDLETARRDGVYDSLRKTLRDSPLATIELIDAAGERGRGGAAFSTATKWRRCAAAPGDEKFMLANGDEGDPGSFIDRVLMEQDPHGVLEGLAIGAYAVGASRAFVFVRSEYPEAHRRMQHAIEEATAAGFLGPSVMETSFALEVSVVSGLGSYVCGEETAMLNAMEGLRGEVRIRPPYPTDAGLLGRPTVVDNVETLINIPWIVEHGADAYASLGTPYSSGTKAVCLNRGFARPGIVEIEFGPTLARIVRDSAGGGRDGVTLDGVLLGGPMGSFVAADAWDVPFCYAAAREHGVRIGHAGLVAVPRGVDLRVLLVHLLRFMRRESCGKCTPCSLGSRQALELAESGPVDDADLDRLLDTISRTSLCAFGREMPKPIREILRRLSGTTLP